MYSTVVDSNYDTQCIKRKYEITGSWAEQGTSTQTKIRDKGEKRKIHFENFVWCTEDEETNDQMSGVKLAAAYLGPLRTWIPV